jgi:hypothetical protein
MRCRRKAGAQGARAWERPIPRWLATRCVNCSRDEQPCDVGRQSHRLSLGSHEMIRAPGPDLGIPNDDSRQERQKRSGPGHDHRSMSEKPHLSLRTQLEILASVRCSEASRRGDKIREDDTAIRLRNQECSSSEKRPLERKALQSRESFDWPPRPRRRGSQPAGIPFAVPAIPG